MHKWLHTNQYLKVSELNEMYICISLRSFAIALFGLFIPAILLSYGYSFTEVILYYFVWAFVSFLGFMLGMELMRHIGIKHVILVSIPFFILLLIGLYTLEYVKWDYSFLAALHGLFSALFWSAFHVEFATVSHKKKTGAEVSWVNILSQSFAILGPVIGGIILVASGPKFIAITCVVLVLASGLPLLLTKDHNLKIPYFWHDLLKPLPLKQTISSIASGMRQIAAMVIWPSFLAIAGLGYLGIGILYTVVRVITIITSYFVGKASDKIHPKKLIGAGTIVHSISMAIRGFLETAASLTAITSIGGFGFILINVPLQKMWYDQAKEIGPLVILKREFCIAIGRLLILTFALVVVIWTGDAIFACLLTFFLGALATLGLNFAE